MTTTLPVPRATIEQIEGFRTRAIETFGQAFDVLREAEHLAACATDNREGPRLGIGDRYSRDWPKGDRDAFLLDRTQHLDRGIWNRLLDHMGLEKLMDAKAREEFRQSLRDNPPPATAENCFATMATLVQDSGLIFRRGLANAFSGLDRRFRSHDGFKIGSRVILSHFYSEFGTMNKDETLRDVERVFCVLDDRPHPERYHGSIIGKLNDAKCNRGGGGNDGWKIGAFEAEDDFFRICVYQNGNAHLWFKRKDLVTKVNQLLAEYYGETLGAGADASADAAHDKAASEPSRAMAKNLGFFETPERVVETLLNDLWIESKRILEPSAGKGAIARALRDAGRTVTCIEIHPDRANHLRAQGFETYCCDFLDRDPEEWTALGLPLFDAVVMNPPFDRGLDVDHVNHALKFVRPGGQLIAVMSAGVEFREDRKTVLFREKVKAMKGKFWDLPARSFEALGTNVNTVTLRINLPEAARAAKAA
jgi:predicted RNA methylase